MALKDVLVPDIGDYSNVDVIEVNVAVGDSVQEEDALITLETDKATMEVPAPFAGVVKALKVNEGDKVSEGDLVLQLEVEGEASEAAPAEEQSTPEAAAPAATASEQEVRVPDIGEYSNVDVIEVTMSVGDEIKEEDSLLTLETDKATMEVPAPFGGNITEVLVKEGDKVSEGDLIAKVKTAAAAAPAQSQSAPAPKQEQAPAPKKAAEPAPAPVVSSGPVHATPSIRRFASELGADLTRVGATGRKGRILKEDVVRYIKSTMTQAQQGCVGGGAGLNLLDDPKVDFAKFGPVKTEKLTRIQKISGANLHRNWVKIPHVTFYDDADITELEAFRKAEKEAAAKRGIKLTPLPFLVRALAGALEEFPRFNSSLTPDGESLAMKEYIHIGVAVDTPSGLMVPVIRDANKKDILDIAKEFGELVQKAQEGKLKPTDMQGGCMTISSLGILGTRYFTPIINMPEVAILGISKSLIEPKWDGKNFEPKLMLPLSLSVDHKVIDGALAAKFLTYLKGLLEDIRKLAL